MKKKYLRLLGLIAIMFCMALCLNVVMFTEHSMQTKCVCGGVAGILYLAVYAIPYWMSRRRGCKQSFCEYVKEMVAEDEL